MSSGGDMEPDLERWLQAVTKNLCEEAQREIRQEIECRHSAAIEAYVVRGLPEAEAQKLALSELGDPRHASRQFRHTHLTKKEAKHLAAFGSPLKSRWYWLLFLVTAVSAVLLSVLERRPELLLIAPVFMLFGWVTMRTREHLRHRSTVGAAIVSMHLTLAAFWALYWAMLSLLGNPAFRSSSAPGLIGGFTGSQISLWWMYHSLWRKAGRRRIVS